MNRTTEMTTEHKERITTLEKRISYGRKMLIKAEDEGRPTDLYTAYIKECKEELAKLKGEWQDTFTIKIIRMEKGVHSKNSWYMATAKYGNRTMQDSLHKSEDGYWWSAGTAHEFKTLAELKSALEQTYRNYFGI